MNGNHVFGFGAGPLGEQARQAAGRRRGGAPLRVRVTRDDIERGRFWSASWDGDPIALAVRRACPSAVRVSASHFCASLPSPGAGGARFYRTPDEAIRWLLAYEDAGGEAAPARFEFPPDARLAARGLVV